MIVESIAGAVVSALVGGIFGAALATVTGVRPIRSDLARLQAQVEVIKSTVELLVDGKINTHHGGKA